MRGKVVFPPVSIEISGITPAYAGKSHLMYTTTSIYQDHPRLCGEKPKFYKLLTDYMGSPPPMRGKETCF